MTSTTLEEWTAFLHIPDLNGPTNNYLYNLRFHSSKISFETMNINTVIPVEEPELPAPLACRKFKVYFDRNNRFNMLSDAF